MQAATASWSSSQAIQRDDDDGSFPPILPACLPEVADKKLKERERERESRVSHFFPHSPTRPSTRRMADGDAHTSALVRWWRPFAMNNPETKRRSKTTSTHTQLGFYKKNQSFKPREREIEIRRMTSCLLVGGRGRKEEEVTDC